MVEHGLPACPPSVLRIPDQLSDLRPREAMQWLGSGPVGAVDGGGEGKCSDPPLPSPIATAILIPRGGRANATPPHPLPLSTPTPSFQGKQFPVFISLPFTAALPQGIGNLLSNVDYRRDFRHSQYYFVLYPFWSVCLA